MNFANAPFREDSADESVKEGYFWANIDSTWTILDQKRLVSLDFLYHRSLEFHNNHHTFRATGDFDYTKDLGLMESNDLVCEILEFRKDRVHGAPLRINAGDYLSYISKFQLPEIGLVWFNIKDLRGLAPLGEILKLHNITLSHFYDLRAHSTVSSAEDGLFVSFCTVTLYGDDAEMHKVYVYCGTKFVVTYERELIAEPEEVQIPLANAVSRDNKRSVVSALTNPSGILSIDTAQSNDIDFRQSQESQHNPPVITTTNPLISPASHRLTPLCVMTSLIGHMKNETYQRICQLGSWYLLYEIGTETLTTTDTLIEFISRTIFHLKQQVHKRISYRQKLHFHRKIGILLSNAKMMVTVIEEVRHNLRSLLDKTSAEFEIPMSQMTWEHILYLSCLIDCYEFKATCLDRQLHDVQSMETAMSHVTNVRNENTSVNLALIATVFLPLTFVAGVFGMNFQEDGGYTMEVLNRKYGPEIFWGICFLVITINLYFFFTTGLLVWKESTGILSADGPRWESEDSHDSGDPRDSNLSQSITGSLTELRGNVVDERSIQEEYRRHTEARTRRQTDARASGQSRKT